MKLISAEKKEKNQVELSILVGKEEFEQACERSYRMNVGKINIQGFRKGKAPRKIIEKLYGPEVFYEDAMNFACEDSYYEAVKAAGITPIDRPAITDLDIKDGEFTYKAIVTVKPEAEIYRILLDRFALNPSETLFIDDREANLRAAEQFGISTFHFTEPREESCDRLRELLLQ